jgi:hypothetical protein
LNSYRDPNAVWRGSPNYSPNRDGHYLESVSSWIVLHTMVGTMQSADARFQNPNQQASAHYGVGYQGALWQWVDEKDAAWHAGDYGCNLDSVGIEHEDMGNYNSPRPDALYQRSARLVADISKRYGIPCRRGTYGSVSGCIDHRTVYATACPDSLDTDRIIREAGVYLAGGDPYGPQPPTQQEDDDMLYVGAKTSKSATLRVFVTGNGYRDPSSSALKTRSLAIGTTVAVSGYLYSTSPIQSPDLGSGVPGPDYCWWFTPTAEFIPDAILDTSSLPGAPPASVPSNEVMNLYLAKAGSGGGDDMSNYATKDDLKKVQAQIPTSAATTLHVPSAASEEASEEAKTPKRFQSSG